MSRHNPKDWIDAQRAAGNDRSNIFADILKAAEQRRVDNRAGIDHRNDYRELRAEVIRHEARAYDAVVDSAKEAKRVPTFTQWQMAQDQAA